MSLNPAQVKQLQIEQIIGRFMPAALCQQIRITEDSTGTMVVKLTLK